MRLVKSYVPDGEWTLWVMGDWHIGNLTFHEDGLKEVRERILEDKNSRVVLTGDLIEGITPDDKRFDYFSLDPKTPTPIAQMKYAAKLAEPIAHLIAGVNRGNHEYKLQKYGDLVLEHFCIPLAVQDKYLGYSGKVSYYDSKGLVFKHYSTHGKRKLSSAAKDPIQRQGNISASAKNIMQRKFGDCLLMTRGHNHHLFYVEPIHELYLTDNGAKLKGRYFKSKPTADYIHPDHRWYGVAGSFFRTYGDVGTENYAEMAEYDPLELGCLKYTIIDRTIVRAERVVV